MNKCKYNNENRIITYGSNVKFFEIGDFRFKYVYRIPVQKKRDANYNAGYIEGYQRALRDFERRARSTLENNSINLFSPYNKTEY